jgi:carbonic anhydrase
VSAETTATRAEHTSSLIIMSGSPVSVNDEDPITPQVCLDEAKKPIASFVSCVDSRANSELDTDHRPEAASMMTWVSELLSQKPDSAP